MASCDVHQMHIDCIYIVLLKFAGSCILLDNFVVVSYLIITLQSDATGLKKMAYVEVIATLILVVWLCWKHSAHRRRREINDGEDSKPGSGGISFTDGVCAGTTWLSLIANVFVLTQNTNHPHRVLVLQLLAAPVSSVW